MSETNYVAAHAVVKSGTATATAWAEPYHFPGANWALYMIIQATNPPAVATCTVCGTGDINCDSNPPPIVTRAIGQGVCTTHVCASTADDSTGGREENKACDNRGNALALAAMNSPNRENAQHQVLPGKICVFVCDGVAVSNCNGGPRLIPTDGRLLPP